MKTVPNWDALAYYNSPQYRIDIGKRQAEEASRRMREKYDPVYIRAAGGDPDTVKGPARRKLVAEGKRIHLRERRAKQNHVKRLHALRRRQAMPPWADVDAIQAIYDEARRLTAETGIPHEVDHIEPLLGKSASGLHVHYNLRVVTRTENRRKGNRPLLL